MPRAGASSESVRKHRAQEHRAAEHPSPAQEQARSDVGAVRVADCDDARRGPAVLGDRGRQVVAARSSVRARRSGMSSWPGAIRRKNRGIVPSSTLPRGLRSDTSADPLAAELDGWRSLPPGRGGGAASSRPCWARARARSRGCSTWLPAGASACHRHPVGARVGQRREPRLDRARCCSSQGGRMTCRRAPRPGRRR